MTLKLVYSKDKKPMITKIGSVVVDENGILAKGFHFYGCSYDEGCILVVKWAIKELEKKLDENNPI